MPTRIAFTVGVVVLALVAAGCGGNDNETTNATTSADDWAAGFCSAVTDWTDELQKVTSELSDPSNLSQDSLQQAAEDVRSATDTLADDLKGLGAPDTTSGQEVKASLDALSNTLETESGEISDTVDGISGIAGIPSAITTITASLSSMGQAFADTLQTVEDADAKGELQSALEDSPECAGISS